jgi:hypothetical protein
MTGQVSRAQRRRTSRSTTIRTANSAATQTKTQIHSSPGMAQPPYRAAVLAGILSPRPGSAYRRGAACTLRCRAGTPTRLRRPRTARRLACWTGCHLGPSAVKGRCALMSARSALRAVP